MEQKLLIVDLLNIYSQFVNFRKNKDMNEQLLEKCLNFFNKQQTVFISKNMYEFSHDFLMKYTKRNSNVKYIIVDEILYDLPGHRYKERDDYILFTMYVLYNKTNNTCSIISNDKFKNFNTIKTNNRPFKLTIFKNGNKSEIIIDKNIISELKKSELSIKKFIFFNKKNKILIG